MERIFFSASSVQLWCVCSFFFHCERKHSTIFVSICHFFWVDQYKRIHLILMGIVLFHCDWWSMIATQSPNWPMLLMMMMMLMVMMKTIEWKFDLFFSMKIKKKRKAKKKATFGRAPALIGIEERKNQQKLIDFHFEFYMLMNECTTRACEIVEISSILSRQKVETVFSSSLVLLLSHSRK